MFQADPQANNLINALCCELKRAADELSFNASMKMSSQHDDSNNNVDSRCNDFDMDYPTFRKQMSKYDLKEAVFSQGNFQFR